MKKRSEILLIVIVIISLVLILNIPKISSTQYISPSDETKINDTYIFEESTSNYNTADQLRPFLRVGKSNLKEYRSLIKFNISSISSTETIINATLQLFVNSSIGAQVNRTIKIYQITSDWTDSQVTWYNRTSENWSTFGGDYVTELNFTRVTNTTGLYYNISLNRIIVQGWLNGSIPNYGLLIMSNDSQNENYTIFSSSNNSVSNQRPKIIINHEANAVPTIESNNTDTTLSSRKNIGGNITFFVNWTDLEINPAKLYVCNSSNINYTAGCKDKLYCNSSLDSSGQSNCSYTALQSDNTTTRFYFAVCDVGSQNCSQVGQNFFYVNHAPILTLTRPNGGEIVNDSNGDYSINFTVSDLDNDIDSSVNIFYGTTQNSTTNIITTDTLSFLCTSSAGGTCSYSPWDTDGLWADIAYVTIIVNDGSLSSNISSASPFSIRSRNDQTPPRINSQTISTSDISSGEDISFSAEIIDDGGSLINASVTITTPGGGTIIKTMANTEGNDYIAYWTATEIGTYTYKVYAQDIIGNLNNSMPSPSFTVRQPTATTQNEKYPSSALPFSLIKISGELNVTDPLKGINATLNVPGGFTFLNDYPNTTSLRNFTGGEIKEAVWIISVPLTQSTYTLNITYTDQYGNSFQGNNFQVQTTSALGGGGSGDFLTISGYPEVEPNESYYIEAYFLSSGVFTNPDSTSISIYNPNGALIIGPVAMLNKTTGIYNYTYPHDINRIYGIWTTAINATKSGITYQQKQFWKVLVSSFDVVVDVLNPRSDNLTFSAYVENKGDIDTDIRIFWNLTNSSGEIASYSATPQILKRTNTTLYHTFSPINYTGSATITVTVVYPQTSWAQRAISHETFTIVSPGAEYCGDGTCNNGESCGSCSRDCGVCPIQPPSGGGGGGGGGGGAMQNQTNITIIKLNFEKLIYLTRNIEKIFPLEVENTGDKELTNINLSLDINNTYYQILSKNPEKIKPGEKYEYKIRFLISEFIAEQNFSFTLKTSEAVKKDYAKIVMLSPKEYFLEEIKRLRNRAEILNSTLFDNNTIKNLRDCEKIIDTVEVNVKEDDYIDAKTNVKNADDCLDKIRDEVKTQGENKLIKTIGYFFITAIIIIILLIIMLIIALFSINKIKRKLIVRDFLDKNPIFSKISKIANPITEPMKKEDFDKKIKDIEDILKKD